MRDREGYERPVSAPLIREVVESGRKFLRTLEVYVEAERGSRLDPPKKEEWARVRDEFATLLDEQHDEFGEVLSRRSGAIFDDLSGRQARREP